MSETAESLCAEFGIRIVPAYRYPMPGETRATVTIERIIHKHGAEHARLVLCLLAECKGNHALIDEMSLYAISRLLLACPDLVEERMSDLLDLFDRLPLGKYMAVTSELRGCIPQANALAGMIYLQLHQMREGSLTGLEPAKGREKRSTISEADKGRREPTRVDERVELGRKLLAVKAELPHGHFGPWLREKSGVSPGMAQKAMQMAKAA